MKNKFIKLLALALCAFLLVPSMTCLVALADESSAASSDASSLNESEMEWEDKWKEIYQPAYTKTAFRSVRDRINGNESGGGRVAPMELYTVIDGYAFYGDSLTGEMIFLVLDKEGKTEDQLTKEAILSTGEIPAYTAFYCTNPYNAGSAKAVGQTTPSDASEIEKLLSQIIIKYSENDKDSTMSSFTHAAANQQIVVKNIRGGVRVEYTIGREEVVYLVPRLIKKEKLEALRDQIDENSLSDRDPKTLMAFYTLKDPDDKTLTEKSKNEMFDAYPISKQFAVYVCEPTISVQELLRLEKLVKNYTNYDYDTLDADHAETEYVAEDQVPPLFKLALEYRVNDGEITIRCNAGNIRFNSSVYKLSDVLVLPYGGAGDVNNSGYMFSPDGSGSLIDFSDLNEQFTNTTSLYGQDYAYHTVSGQNREVARLPVFGVYQRVENDSVRTEIVPVYDDEGNPLLDAEGNPMTEEKEVSVPLEIAYLAVIEEGDSLANINIAYGGPVHNFASIYTSFNPRPKDSYILDGGISAGTNAMWTVESKRKYTGDFQIRLFILDGTEDGDKATSVFDADKSYSDMAAAYRDYLVRTGVLKKVDDLDKDIPLYLETLGAIGSTKTVFGIPMDTTIALTSFQDTIKILESLEKDYSIGNVKVKLNGWCNGGLMGDIATTIEIEETLGGEEGFKKLVDYANKHNVTIFPDVELTFAYSDNMFDGFSSDENLAQTIDERSAFLKEYHPITHEFVVGNEGIISTSFMKELYDSANNDYSKLNVGAISVGTLGKYLSSDFNTDNPLTREDSKELVTQLLRTISANNKKVLVTAGNEYTLDYVTDILEVPMDDSRLLYSYATVPFMSMVLHGYKEYTGTALNLAGDYNYHLLKTIESGASPYFIIAANNTSELKKQNDFALSKYYSVRYAIWEDDIVYAYNQINKALSDVQNAVIKKHEILSADGKVAKVLYDNNVVFFINYGEKDFAVEGLDELVPVNGYIKAVVEGEGENETIKIVDRWEGVEE